MKHACTLLPGVLLVLVVGTQAVAQDIPLVDAGSVATVVIPFAGGGARGGSFRVTANTGVRLLSAAAGDVAAGSTGLPVSFAVSRHQGAGLLRALQLIISDAGTADTINVDIVISRRQALRSRAWLTPSQVAPGAWSTLQYAITNSGNAADTVFVEVGVGEEWDVERPRSVVAVPANDTVFGSIRLRAPRELALGHVEVVHLRVRSGSLEAHAAATAFISAASSATPVARLPTTLTVAAPLAAQQGEPASYGYGIEAAGDLGPETGMILRYFQAPAAGSPLPSLAMPMGSHFLFGIRRPQWQITAGDVFQDQPSLMGVQTSGKGVDARVRLGDVAINALLAQRHVSLADESQTAQLTSAWRRAHTHVRLDLLAIDQSAGGTLRAAATELGWEKAQHRVQVEGSMLQYQVAGVTESKPGVELGYWFNGAGANGVLLARSIPDGATLYGALASELRGAGKLRLSRGWSLDARAGAYRIPASTTQLGSWHRNAAAGFSYQLGRSFISALANYRDDSGLFPGTSRTLLAAALVPVARGWVVDAGVELGEQQSDTLRAGIASMRVHTVWNTSRSSFRLGVNRTDFGTGGASFRIDANTTYQSGLLRVDAGTMWSLQPSQPLPLWGSVGYSVSRATTLTLAVERMPITTSDKWRMSLVARQQLALPLPVRDPGQVRGRVYYDVNANYRFDPSDSLLTDVPVQYANTTVRTDAQGRYHFIHVPGAYTHINPGDVRPGLILPQASSRRTGAHDFGLVCTGSLRVLVYQDVDGDGELGVREPGAAAALVTVTDERGRMLRDKTDEQGLLRFNALPVGSYTVHVYTSENQRQDPRVLPIPLKCGDETPVITPAPTRPREIRFRVIP